MKKYAKHFEAIIGLIPVLEAASHSIPTPTPPSSFLLSNSPLSLFPSLQPCFFPFIPIVFFLHPPSLLIAYTFPPSKLLRALSNSFLCNICYCCWLHFCCIYTHFPLLNPEASLCTFAWVHANSCAFNHIHTHKLTCTFWLSIHTDRYGPIHKKKKKKSSADLIWFYAKHWQ